MVQPGTERCEEERRELAWKREGRTVRDIEACEDSSVLILLNISVTLRMQNGASVPDTKHILVKLSM
jgi:hypothetical protein